jgi:hypothetical protein
MYQELLMDVLSFFDLVMRNHNNRTVRLPPQLVGSHEMLFHQLLERRKRICDFNTPRARSLEGPSYQDP